MIERGGYYWDVLAWRNSRTVRRMDVMARAIYREVIDEIWVSGYVNDSEEEISRLFNVPLSDVQNAWKQIKEALTPTKSDPSRLTSSRLEEERLRRDKIRRKKRKAGKLGGLKSGEQRRSAAEADASIVAKQNEPITSPITSTSTNTRKGKGNALGHSPEFERFWQSYPRKIAKAAALRAWVKRDGTLPPIEQILESLEKAKQSPAWTKDGGQFIPHPATWINGARWEDEHATHQRSNAGGRGETRKPGYPEPYKPKPRQ